MSDKLDRFSKRARKGLTMAQEEALRDFVAQNEEAAEIMEMAYKLEGLARNVGKHAGGVVIAPTTLTDFAPLYSDESGGGLVTQFDKDDVEKVGLVKFDFLGLRNGREVYLCWRYGEENLAFWHELNTGFAGRHPLDEYVQ